MQDLSANWTHDPIMHMRMGRSATRDIRRVVAMGIRLPIQKQNSLAFNVSYNLLHKRGAKWSYFKHCSREESSMECGHATHYSIDELHLPQLGANLTATFYLKTLQ